MYKKLLRVLVKLPYFSRYSNWIYRQLGMKITKSTKLSNFTIYGDPSNITCEENAEINWGCFLLAKDKIHIGNNSTLAYNVSLITSANPNFPHNTLSKVYPPFTAPISIGNNVWVGANVTILPGITIGDESVIAAGSLVNKDVPSRTLVGGVPAKIIKCICIN